MEFNSTNEREDIARLLEDFPTERTYSPEEVLRLANIRYSELGHYLFDAFLPDLTRSTTPFETLFYDLSLKFHKFMFMQIFSNAGQFRSSTDKNSGQVYFGPVHKKTGRAAEFTGVAPGKIPDQLREVFKDYSRTDDNPEFTSIKVYQQFVYIHPFYDANGRVARLLTSLYLGFHQRIVQWKPLESEEKLQFINKLNRCHRSMGRNHYENRLNDLCSFWQKYVKPIPEE
ncbi:MAG: Fic family protein [Calditrichaeota bacterium]|nr:Fic family protein [Calditrichota bacterium]MCB0268346.1 Fic family protein [Calditrichota bacterium]